MSPKAAAARSKKKKTRKVNAGKVILGFAKSVHGDVKKQRRPHPLVQVVRLAAKRLQFPADGQHLLAAQIGAEVIEGAVALRGIR